MSNAMMLLEMSADGEVVPTGRGGRGMSTLWFAEERNPHRVLEPDRNPRTLVVIIHEEAINQFPGMPYFGGVFSEGEVSVRAMDYIPEDPYPMRATIDVAGFWRLRGFSRFPVIHLVLSCIGQCFGH
jgi:hypothetical protein